MKNLFAISALVILMLFGAQTPTQAQDKMPELDKSPMDMAYFPARAPFRAFEKDATKKAGLTPVMRVIYSRPQLNGRPLSELIKKGEVYRLGANENTELDVMSPVKIGNAVIEPGRYSLYTISEGEEDATLIINRDLDAWGAYSYRKGNDVARVKGNVSVSEEKVEAMTIMFTETSLLIAWGNRRIEFPVEKVGL